MTISNSILNDIGNINFRRAVKALENNAPVPKGGLSRNIRNCIRALEQGKPAPIYTIEDNRIRQILQEVENAH